MSFKKKSLIFYLVLLLNLGLLLVPIFQNTPTSSLLNAETKIDFFQRISGVVVFVLLFYQMLLGAFQKWFIDKLGSWIYKLHMVTGLVAYGLILVHGILYSFLSYEITGNLELFLAPSGIYPKNYEFSVGLGWMAFLLLTLTIIVALYRAKKILRRVWQKIHNLNYVVFGLILFHLRGVGTDVTTGTFPVVLNIMTAVFVGVVLVKIYKYFENNK